MASFIIVFILILANVTVLFTSSLWVVLILWLTALIGMIKKSTFKIHMLFLLVTVVPMFAALLIVWLSANERAVEINTIYDGNVYLYVTFLTLRIAAIGGVLQWLLLPLIKEKKFERFLREIGCNKHIILAITSTLVLLEDFKRKSKVVVEARIARGLVGKSRLAKWRSFPSTISPVIYTSIISAIQRSDLWAHRDLDVIGVKASEQEFSKSSVTDYLLLFWFVTIALFSLFLGEF